MEYQLIISNLFYDYKLKMNKDKDFFLIKRGHKSKGWLD